MMEVLRFYLDTCVWCRPFDEPSRRVTEEAEAFFKILHGVDEKRYILTKADKIERSGIKVRNPVDLNLGEAENGYGS